MIRTIVLFMTLVICLYAFRKGRDIPVLVFIILAPLTYFAQNIGIVLDPAKLMGLLFLSIVPFRTNYLSLLKNKHLKKFTAYYWYTIFLTMFMSPLWPEYSVVAQGFFYGNTMRGWVQIAQVGMGIAIIVVIIRGLSDTDSLHRTQTALLWSMIMLSIYGLYVWFAQKNGLPFNMINRQGGSNSADIERLIRASIGGYYEVRAYSLSGEPKSLAVNACLGIVLSLFTVASSSRFLKGTKTQLLLVSLFLITLYLTFSTAGYLILPMIVLTALSCKIFSKQISQRLVSRIVAVTVVGIIVAIFNMEFISNKLTEVFSVRVSSRLSDQGLFTFAEDAMSTFMLANPLQLFSGVGLGGSAFYIRLYDISSYSGYIASPRGIIGFIGDKGLIGLWLFSSAIFSACRVLLRSSLSGSPHRYVYGGIIVICMSNYLLLFTYSLWYIEWLTVGLACAGATVAEREQAAKQFGNKTTASFSYKPSMQEKQAGDWLAQKKYKL